jgi:hypothetical protein
MKLHAHATGLTAGILCALWHAGWVALVALKAAEPLFKRVMSLHFISTPYVIEPLDPVKGVLLVAAAFIGAYLLGLIFALVYNTLSGE